MATRARGGNYKATIKDFVFPENPTLAAIYNGLTVRSRDESICRDIDHLEKNGLLVTTTGTNAGSINAIIAACSGNHLDNDD